jgi:hypothetical protein
MALVDDRGRIFGRFNVVDAFLVVFVVALVPLAYASYVLFRTPPPQLTAIEPPTVQHAPEMRITIRGRDLRPYMRIVVGDKQAKNFLFYNATTAEVDLPELPPGVYDVALYDYAQERARLADALTIAPPPLPSTQVEVVGAFRSLSPATAKLLNSGMELAQLGKVERLGDPRPSLIRATAGQGTVEIPIDAVDVPAVIRMGCNLQGSAPFVHCYAGGTALMPDAYLTLPTAGGALPFQIDQVRAPTALQAVAVTVRFTGEAQTLAMIQRGDIDIGVVRNPLASGGEVLDVQPANGNTRLVALQVPAQPGVGGWRYAGSELRSGAPFRLATERYEIGGTVLTVTPTVPPAPTPQ